jgi:hypothetical protein
MVHLTLGEWRVACARVTVPEGDLVLACGALATPTESPPQTIPGEGTMLTCTGGALTESPSVVGCHSDGMGCSPRTRVHLGRASAGACGPGVRNLV